MLAEQRLAYILNEVKQNNFCTIQQLAQGARVSPATIRRDLQTLASQDRVRLTRGGAMDKMANTAEEPEYAVKSMLNLEEKTRIAAEACRLIHPGETILLDTGTTVYQMIQGLRQIENITIVTNDVRIAAELAMYPEISLCMLGGQVRKNYYTTTGLWTQQALESLHVDKCFLSCDAVHLLSGCSITNVEEIAGKLSMMKASNECVLLADHSKFQSIAFMRLCDLTRFQSVITGSELDRRIAQEYLDAGIRLRLV